MEFETYRFYIYSSPYQFQVPIRTRLWEKLTWDEQNLYYSALSDLDATGWTVPGFTGKRPKVITLVHKGKIIGFSYEVTDGYRKAFIIATLFPLQSLSVDERLDGRP